MDKFKNRNIENMAKTPLGTTVLITLIILIILMIIIYAINNILMVDTIDNSTLFLALLPFLIYLVLSNKISEIGGGGLAIKFYKASESEVVFKKEVPYFNEEAVVKWNVEYLRNEILPKFAENPRTALKVKKEYKGKYAYSTSKKYLEELTKFDSFKYVLFVDENNLFDGYMNARSLLAQLISEDLGNWIIDKINEWNLDMIPGFKKEHVKNYQSSREVLRIMEEEKITDLAVVDKDMKFLGFTNRELIITHIVKNAIIKEE